MIKGVGFLQSLRMCTANASIAHEVSHNYNSYLLLNFETVTRPGKTTRVKSGPFLLMYRYAFEGM